MFIPNLSAIYWCFGDEEPTGKFIVTFGFVMTIYISYMLKLPDEKLDEDNDFI
jgi:hypothetical protein